MNNTDKVIDYYEDANQCNTFSTIINIVVNFHNSLYYVWAGLCKAILYQF